MRKGFLLTAIILWTLVAVTVIGIVIFGVKGGFHPMEKTAALVKNEQVLLSNIQDIVVEGTSQTVEIRKTSGDSIQISQYGNPRMRSEKLFLFSVTDDQVRIYFDDTWYFNFFNFNIYEKLVIEIPENYKGNLDATTSSGGVKTVDAFTLKKVLLQSSSGGIYINSDLTADTLDADTASGGIHIAGNISATGDMTVQSSSGGIKLDGVITAKNLNVDTSSGGIRSARNIDVQEKTVFNSLSGGLYLDGSIKGKELNVKTNSGGIYLGNVNVGNYYIHSSSGGIKIDSISGAGETETSSGGIRVSLKDPKDSVKFTSSSGGIAVTLEPSLQFTLDAQTNSGSIHANFAIEKNEKGNKVTAKIGNNPAAHIIAHTSSGGIKIEN